MDKRKHIKKFADVNKDAQKDFFRQEDNNSNTYPVKTEQEALKLLSGRSRGGHRARKYQDDLIDVFGKEASILQGDEVTEYLQVWSTDNSLIYKVTRRNRLRTWHLYIPSKFQEIDQYDKIDGTR